MPNQHTDRYRRIVWGYVQGGGPLTAIVRRFQGTFLAVVAGRKQISAFFFLSSNFAGCCESVVAFSCGITAEVTHHTNAGLLAGCPPRRNTADERRSDANTQHASSIGSPITAHKEEVLLHVHSLGGKEADTHGRTLHTIYPNRLLWIVFAFCVVPSRMQLTASGLHVQGYD